MGPSPAAVVVLDRAIEASELARLVKSHFEDMVKYVVDVERRILAVGGEMYSDAEQLMDPALREKVREITFALLGQGEALA